MAPKKNKKQRKKRSKFALLLMIIGLVGLTVALSFAILLFMLGMLPAFVANYVDASNERFHFRIVTACNLAGVLPYLAELWKNGISSESVHTMLLTPTVWMMMYGAAAMGWFLVWFFPKGVHFVLNIVRRGNVSALQAQQQSIVDEWGLEVESAARRMLRNTNFTEEQKAARRNSESGGNAAVPQLPAPSS